MSIQAIIFSMLLRYQMADFYKDLSIEVQRTKMNKYAGMIKIPSGITCAPVNVGGIPADSIGNPDVKQDQAIIYLHGGAYFLNYGNPQRDLAARIERSTKMRVFILDFRLSPEHPYPAALEDVTTAYQWLLQQGYSSINIAIVGESSGGGLALASSLKLRDANIPLPAAVVCLCPWTDLTGSGASIVSKAKVDFINKPEHMRTNAKRYAGNHDLKNPYVSPLFANLNGFPPLLIQAASRDVLLDDAIRLAEQARNEKVNVTLEVWDDMIHVFQLSAGFVPEARKAVENIAIFLQQYVGVQR